MSLIQNQTTLKIPPFAPKQFEQKLIFHLLWFQVPFTANWMTFVQIVNDISRVLGRYVLFSHLVQNLPPGDTVQLKPLNLRWQFFGDIFLLAHLAICVKFIEPGIILSEKLRCYTLFPSSTSSSTSHPPLTSFIYFMTVNFIMAWMNWGWYYLIGNMIRKKVVPHFPS